MWLFGSIEWAKIFKTWFKVTPHEICCFDFQDGKCCFEKSIFYQEKHFFFGNYFLTSLIQMANVVITITAVADYCVYSGSTLGLHWLPPICLWARTPQHCKFCTNTEPKDNSSHRLSLASGKTLASLTQLPIDLQWLLPPTALECPSERRGRCTTI